MDKSVNLHPILLDARPGYLGQAPETVSLLLLRLGAEPVAERARAEVSGLTDIAPVVLAAFEPGSAYRAALAHAVPGLGRVVGPGEARAWLDTLEPSDSLLVVDPGRLAAEGPDLARLLAERSDPRWACHLVALDGVEGGTREFVDEDESGRVRRIQRFYAPVTWPFSGAVCASVLPAGGARLGGRNAWTSLTELRGTLARQGAPARDLALAGPAFDLREERGALAAAEFFARRATRGRGQGHRPLFVGTRQRVARSARLVGAVVVHEDAVIEEDATVVGPAVIGEGAHVGSGALVAQSVLSAGTHVPAGCVLRHRVLAASELPPPEDAEPPPACLEPAVARATARPSRYARCKPAVEAGLASAALIVLSPLFALVGLLIKLDSRGPVLYGQKREGRDGRVFRCWKFRTMHDGAEAVERELHARSQVDGPQFKLERDPRVTRMGRWLRPTSLDELPQLINVARGEMSFVGPRPSPFRENQLCVPWREGRLSVRPGITGLWQVCRHDRRHGDFHQWIQYDLLYVRNVSARLDLNILAATLLTLGGKGHVSLSAVLPQERGGYEA
jgi:lipopolysaccharide/colanic/teichoic acid biosynthesis glycosyltransferase